MKAKIMDIARHRMGWDGEGVSTLVGFWGCPLHCRYCINDFCHDEKEPCEELTSEELIERLSVDEIYYQMTGGGIVFGGGEPLLYAEYIEETVKIFPKEWAVRIETSLNVPYDSIRRLIPYVDQWIVDIKEMDPEKYRRYTGVDGRMAHENLVRLSGEVGKEKILCRIPLIPGYNTEEDQKKNADYLNEYGELDLFTYQMNGS